MKKVILASLILCAAFALVGCGTLADIAANAIGGAASSGASSAASGASTATMEFKAGEILASDSTDTTMIGARFYLAKVQTPASAATKNQAEVIWIGDGSKAWVNYVVESRKATKEELKVGAYALFPAGWSGYDTMDQDNYRKTSWILGRVTDISDLFKGRVEVNGDSFNVALLRVPTSAVK